MGRFRFREDVSIADCAVEVWGDSLADLLATAARALAELMVEPGTFGERETRAVSLEAESTELLLHDWLSELIFLKDRDRAIFPRAEVRAGEAPPFRLDATLHGDVVDPASTRRGIDVKAITLHELRAEREGAGWHGHFVADL